MEPHSPPSSPPRNPTWGSKDTKDAKLPSKWNDAAGNQLPGKMEQMQLAGDMNGEAKRKRIVVVGLGMVGIAFM